MPLPESLFIAPCVFWVSAPSRQPKSLWQEPGAQGMVRWADAHEFQCPTDATCFHLQGGSSSYIRRWPYFRRRKGQTTLGVICTAAPSPPRLSGTTLTGLRSGQEEEEGAQQWVFNLDGSLNHENCFGLVPRFQSSSAEMRYLTAF